MAYPSSFSSSISSSSSSRKRLWCQEEDKTLTECVGKYGPRNWNKLPRISGLRRSGNSCRFRWMNHLNPKVNRGDFTKEEDEIIIKAHRSYGNQWSKIALKLTGRTDNQIKNRWNTHMSKKEVVSEEDGIPKHSEIHQNIFHKPTCEPFPENEFQLWNFPSTTFTWG